MHVYLNMKEDPFTSVYTHYFDVLLFFLLLLSFLVLVQLYKNKKNVYFILPIILTVILI